jgi:CheY-like chemotaxis protein
MGTSLLAVDDEAQMLELIRYAGEEAGCEVRVVKTASDFMTSHQVEQPDLIVMDIIMPGMDGIELLSWLDKQGCNAPVVLITGFDEMYLTSAREFASINRVRPIRTIRKPFRIAELAAKLRELKDKPEAAS